MTHLRFSYEEDDEELADAPCEAGPSAPPAGLGHAPAGAADVSRLRVAQTVVTSFNPASDACYVLDIATSGDEALVACSLSDFSVKLYARGPDGLLSHARDWRGHRGRVSGLSFPLAEAPQVGLTCSADGCCAFWDARAPGGGPAARFGAPAAGELAAAAVGGTGDALLAAAGDDGVAFYDRRAPGARTLARFTEAHADALTAAMFHPEHRNALVTGGVDGLACVFDCGALADEEAALSGVLSVGSTVARLGFCGAGGARLWATTGTEELSLWRWADYERLGSAPDTRAAAAAAAALCPSAAAAMVGEEHQVAVDYLVRCEWDAVQQRLWLLAGTQGGAVAAFPVSEPDPNAALHLGPPGLLLAGGHGDVVRAVEWRPERGAGRGALSGGEDSRLCVWAPPQPDAAAEEGPAAMEEPQPVVHGAARRSVSSDSARFSPY